MAVFEKPTSNFPVFGKLQYGSAYWLGQIMLEPFAEPFELIVRAKREGPSEAQIAAMRRVVSDARAIKNLASKGMVAAHEESEMLPSGFGLDADQIWQYLEPAQVEVSDENYYDNGRIAVTIIFGSTQHPAFGPAIETADGHFVEVLSGT